jgi:hypothetical protein
VSTPTPLQIRDGISKRLVHVAHVYGRLFLTTIGVKSIAMTKAMSVVIANKRLPNSIRIQFYLNSKLIYRFPPAPVEAAQLRFASNQSFNPTALDNFTGAHPMPRLSFSV